MNRNLLFIVAGIMILVLAAALFLMATVEPGGNVAEKGYGVFEESAYLQHSNDALKQARSPLEHEEGALKKERIPPSNPQVRKSVKLERLLALLKAYEDPAMIHYHHVVEKERMERFLAPIMRRNRVFVVKGEFLQRAFTIPGRCFFNVAFESNRTLKAKKK